MIVERFRSGIAICGDACDPSVLAAARQELSGSQASLIIGDPPYGLIVSDKWDKTNDNDDAFSDWMISWTRSWNDLLCAGGAFYVWGGTGKVCFRPFFKYMCKAEIAGSFELANLITWKKRRGYGVRTNYLYTREELAYFVKGNAKTPKLFNVPYLEEIRPYKGFKKKYPALDDRYRRTNVWTDITELMQGKRHIAEKRQRCIEIPIEVHTQKNDWVIDPFCGSGTTALACMQLSRRFIVVEKDEQIFDATITHMRNVESARV